MDWFVDEYPSSGTIDVEPPTAAVFISSISRNTDKTRTGSAPLNIGNYIQHTISGRRSQKLSTATIYIIVCVRS